MSKGIPEYFAHKKYNISPEDITRLVLSRIILDTLCDERSS